MGHFILFFLEPHLLCLLLVIQFYVCGRLGIGIFKILFLLPHMMMATLPQLIDNFSISLHFFIESLVLLQTTLNLKQSVGSFSLIIRSRELVRRIVINTSLALSVILWFLVNLIRIQCCIRNEALAVSLGSSSAHRLSQKIVQFCRFLLLC